MKLFAAIRRAKTAHEILNCLLLPAIKRGICRIRYYHYSQKESKCVSVESAGHDKGLAKRFRNGLIVKQFASRPLNRWDSFWCFSLGEPVVIRVKPGSPLPLRARNEHGIKVILIPQEQCGHSLKGQKSRVWVDLPLRIAGNYVGKFSCDLTSRHLDATTKARIFHFWELAQLAAPYLEAFFAQEVSSPVSSLSTHLPKGLPRAMVPRPAPQELLETISRLQSCNTSDQLFASCVDDLPRRLFNCKYASFFTILTDSHGAKKLVLRRSSHPSCRSLENLAFYTLDEEGLTPWVAKHKRPLRLHELAARDFNQKSGRHGNDLRWKNKIQDSDTHNSFLAMPILASSGELLGVIRLTQKSSKFGRFTEKDQQLLKLLLADFIGPRLQLLRHTEVSHEIFKKLHEVVSIAVTDSVHTLDLPLALGGLLKTVFKDHPKSRKAFVINLLNEDRTRFRHVHLGGSLPFLTFEGSEFPLEDTFTGLVVKSGRKGTTFLHDFETAKIMRAVHRRSPEAKCGMACPITFDEKLFGIIAVLSDRYDLDPESHGPLLEIACIQAGGIYACRTLNSFRLSEMGLRHDVIGLLRRSETLIKRQVGNCSRPTNDIPFNLLSEAYDSTGFALRLVDAYCHNFPIPPVALERNRIPAELHREISLAVRAAEQETGGYTRVECNIDRKMEPLIYPAPILAIIYNLLKNALAACGIDGRVLIEARLHNGSLELRVSDTGETVSYAQINETLALDPVKLNEANPADDATQYRKGLFLCSKLARCYELPTGCHGSLSAAQGKRPFACTVKLIIPL